MSRPASRTTTRAAAALVTVVLLAGCAIEGPAVAGVPGLQWPIERFYLGRATENGGMCTAPAIRSITQATVLEEGEDEVVMRLRYFWRDESMRQEQELVPLTGAISCQGFAERDFTFARMSDGSLEPIAMSGERRNVRQNFNTRTGGS